MKILIVEDNPADLKSLRAWLEQAGHKVIEAGDGVEALELLDHGSVEAVIADILMPRMDGYRLCLEMRKRDELSTVPLILYTATSSSKADREAAKAMGADQCLPKSASAAEILEALEQAVEERRRLSGSGGHEAARSTPTEQYTARLIAKLEQRNKELEAQAEALRESREQVRLQAAALATAANAIMISGRDGLIVWVNPAFTELTGYSPAEVIGQSPRILKSGHHDPQFYKKLWQMIVAGKIWKGEFTNRRKDGSLYRCEETITPVLSDAGVVSHFVGIMNDVTQRRRAEESLRESQERYRDLFDNAHDLILSVSPQGTILYANRACRDALGYGDEELAQVRLEHLLHADRRPQAEELFGKVLAGDQITLAELDFAAKDGRRVILEGGLGPQLVQGQPAAVRCILRDVTERKRFEAQLLRNQRMESIGTLAGGIAHDLNNALAPILMSVALLRTKTSDPEAVEILRTIETSAQRGADMVKQVLAFSRGAEGKRAEVQVKHLVKEMQAIVQQTFPKSIHFRTVLGRDLWKVQGDATQLHQVLLNLCVNARDAMPNGGKLSIKAENIVLDEHYAGMNPEAKAGPYLLINVIDTGMGMAASVRDRIFEPFFTTKPVGHGTGLGLSTVRGIVKGHGGFVSVYSEVGEGSEFKVYLPAQVEPATHVATPDAPPLPTGRGELILVVDDEASVRNITQQTLEIFGYRVLTANDGAQAVAVCAQHPGQIQLMLTDMAMPIMDGAAAIRAVRSLDPQIRIISASGMPKTSGSTDTDHFRISAKLQKPYTAERLLTVVREVLDGPGPA